MPYKKAVSLFGTSQSSGNSPTYWLFIGSTLFDLYDAKAHASKYQSPDKSVEVEVKAVGFVDDVCVGHTGTWLTYRPYSKSKQYGHFTGDLSLLI